MTAKTEWRSSPVNLPVDPELALNELERIRQLNEGRLIASMVVRESEPKTAPLHPLFEWRNSVAAEKYREYQARNVIKMVRYVTIDDEGKPAARPAYVHVSVTGGDGKKESYYQNINVAINRPDEWMSAIQNAQLKLNALKRSLDELNAMAHQSTDSERLERLTIAAMAFQTLQNALRH